MTDAETLALVNKMFDALTHGQNPNGAITELERAGYHARWYPDVRTLEIVYSEESLT